MKVVILAGGYGTRLSEETGIIPKPLVEIGGRPIIWHIMRIYSHYGFTSLLSAAATKARPSRITFFIGFRIWAI